MKAPAVRTVINGAMKTLYMSTVADIKRKTKGNLKKSLQGKVFTLSVSIEKCEPQRHHQAYSRNLDDDYHRNQQREFSSVQSTTATVV